MKFSSATALAGVLLLPICAAQENITIGLYQTSTPQACTDGAGAPSKGIAVTSGSFSAYSVCFNVQEIFAANSSTTGWARHPLPGPGTGGRGIITPDRDGFNYTLLNRGNYNSTASYNGIYVESYNSSNEYGQDKPAARRVEFYQSEGCGFRPSNYSYIISCQTMIGGVCRNVQPVKSFRIVSYSEVLLNNPNDTDKCTAFTQIGAATSRSVTTGLVIGVSSMLALWLAL
jgi:hypothetical protein